MSFDRSVITTKGVFLKECQAYVRGIVNPKDPQRGLTGGVEFFPFQKTLKRKMDPEILVYRVKKQFLEALHFPQVVENMFCPIIIKTSEGFFLATVHKNSLRKNFKARGH